MKKIHFIPKSWKRKKRTSFAVYFGLFTAIVVAVAIAVPNAVYAIINSITGESTLLHEILIVCGCSLLVSVVLSYFIGKILLSPVKKLQSSMEEVAGGNFDIQIKEDSKLDEVEDMYHYFNMMVRELKATETIQTDFISNASHEFKTPLSAIEGYVALLSEQNLSEEEKNLYVEKILLNTKRMSQLVHNVLLLSKLDNHGIQKQSSVYLLDEQIRQSILFLESKWVEKNIEFDVDFKTVKYFGSETLMMHVWNNLIDNAIKFSPPNGKIKMRLKTVAKQIIFTIEDEGVGIEEESKKYVFNKFYQSDSSHKQEGYGLGLALVKRIVDLSYGNVYVDNLEPSGCRFTVILPIYTQKER